MASINQTLEILWRGQEGFRARFVDLGLLLLLVGLGSWAFDDAPMAWIHTNPSPFFLIPLLMGGKYGQSAGVVSGAVAALFLIAATCSLSGRSPYDVMDDFTFLLVCLPLCGLICGEIRGVLFHEAARSGIQLKQAGHRLRALDEQVFILSEAKDDLDRELAMMSADTANLDYEIRRVLQSPTERFYEALLGVFCRKGGLYEAAIYGAGEPWVRKAFAGNSEQWAETYRAEDSAVVRKALEFSTIATLPEVWGDSPVLADDFLVACPIGEQGNPSAILLVQNMMFTSMNIRGLQTIEMICRWVSEFSGLERRAKGLFDPRGIVPMDAFDRMLDLAGIVQRRFRLISSVILFRPADGKVATLEQMHKSITGAVRVGDILSHIEGHSMHIFLLLPLTGRRGAEICAARFLEFVTHAGHDRVPLTGEIFCTNEFPAEGALWAAMLASLDKV